MLAGGNLPEILARSEEPLLRGLSRGSIRPQEGLHAADPLRWAPRLDPQHVLLVHARWDRVIPTQASDRLSHALGDARELTYPSGHYSFQWFLPAAATRALHHAERTCPI